ncbi:MAG: META domain-containing protein [Anaerolineaceae bacterium]
MKTKSGSLFLITIVILSTFLLSACGLINAKDTLNETSWLLTAIDDAPTLEGTKVTAEFSEGQIGGSSGCNSYGGSYETKGEKITTSSIVMTLMACQDASIMEQEQTFLQYLQDAQTFQISGKQLQIFDSNGRALTFIQE